MSTKALPTGSLVLVTGVNGYVASHVADQLLQSGYKVRGTARSQDKLDGILSTLRKRNPNGSIDGVVVADMTSEGAFNEAGKGAAGIVHVASDVSFGSDANQVINVAVKGVENALRAAANTPTVKRFVYTSSVAAVIPQEAFGQQIKVDSKSWNETDVNRALAPPPHDPSYPIYVYSASKTRSEQAAYKFVEDNKPSFTLSTVNPTIILGEIMEGSNGSSGGMLYNTYKGEKNFFEGFHGIPWWAVNVKDCARLHLAALLEPDVKGERLFAFGTPGVWSELIGALKKIDPSKDHFTEPLAEEKRSRIEVDLKREVELLKRYGAEGFSGLEETLRENVGK